MGAVVTVILPVFGIMLAGILAGRFRLLGEGSSEMLNRFVYYVTLPPLFFISLARVPVDEIFNGPFLAAFGGGLLGTFGIALLIGVFVFPGRLAALGLHGLCAIFSNTGYLGIPLLIILFGEFGKLPAVISTVIMGTVVIGVGVALIEADLSQGRGAAKILASVGKGVGTSPLILSAAVGLLASALGVPVPVALATFCDIIGAAASPCALFAIGLFLSGQTIATGYTETGWLVVLKLLVQPAITGWLAFGVMSMDPEWAAAAVVQAALPTGTLVFVLAQQYGIFVQRATATIMVSTVLSVFTLTALFALLGLG